MQNLLASPFSAATSLISPLLLTINFTIIVCLNSFSPFGMRILRATFSIFKLLTRYLLHASSPPVKDASTSTFVKIFSMSASVSGEVTCDLAVLTTQKRVIRKAVKTHILIYYLSNIHKPFQIPFIFFSWPSLFAHSFTGMKNGRLELYAVQFFRRCNILIKFYGFAVLHTLK